MHEIAGPKSTEDYPNRDIDCQFAISKRYLEVMAIEDVTECLMAGVVLINDAVKAGWRAEEVDAALKAFLKSEQAGLH